MALKVYRRFLNVASDAQVTNMMTTKPFDDLDNAFDDHSSLAPSIEDFEEQQQRSPLFGLPSQHSGFRSEPPDSEPDAASSNGEPWSPPGFRGHSRGGSGWFRHDPYSIGQRLALQPSMSPSRGSRQTSPEYQDAQEGDEDLTIAANVPLPAGTDSPYKERSPEPEPGLPPIPHAFAPAPLEVQSNIDNYIRFSVRADVQQREPITAVVNFVKSKLDAMTNTKSSTILTILLSLLSLSIFRILLVPPTPPPVPDLVKLSTLAKSFEPLVVYSENSYGHITTLQETSVAVWDLGESVRSANMTSGPEIVRSLDELSDNLKTLGLELTRFFSDVDADVDGILIVMDWAKRELAGIEAPQTGAVAISTMVFDNIHNLLNRGSFLERHGNPTTLGKLVTDLFGASSSQRTRATLTRTFHEFLNVLEDSINSEITHSAALFALFEAIDRQFLNLRRAVARETDTQERLETDTLDSLWMKLMGSKAAALRKYEKNKQLLASVYSRTYGHKHMIVEHHGRLQTLKVNLETLRRKLVSPLVQRNDSVQTGTGSVVESQIRGLEGTYEYLKNVREKQKSRLMEVVYGAGRQHTRIVGVDARGIESR